MIRMKVKEKKSLFRNKRDNYTGKFRKKELINYLRNELRTCTTHGIPYIVNTGIHWTERLFWAISFSSCLAVLILLLSSQLSRLMNKPTVMSVEKNYLNWNMSFPAITICPKWKIENESLATLYQYPELNMTDIITVFNYLNLKNIDRVHWLQDSNFFQVIHPRDIPQLAVLIFKKFYEGLLSKGSDWSVSVDVAMTEMGLCHVLNSNVAVFDNPFNWNNSKIVYKKEGVQLSVHDVDFFIQIMNYDQSFEIFIHSPDEIVLSSSPSSIFDTAGHQSFGVKIWSTRIAERLRNRPISFRKCRFIDEPISKRYPVYSYNHCILECRIMLINNLCGCIPHFYKPLDSERVCSLNGLKCVVDYIADITTLAAQKVAIGYKNEMTQTPPACQCLTACETDVYLKEKEAFIPLNSMNKLKVTMSFPKVRVVRDLIISTYDVILRTGGVINLCIGASVASLFELVIIFIKALKLTK